MPSKSTKTVKSVKPVKTAKVVRKKPAKVPAKAVAAKSSRKSAPQSRNKFIALAVLVAVVLIAIIGSIVTNPKQDPVPTISLPGSTEGAMYLQVADTYDLKPGSTVMVTVSENSGNEPVNAVQTAVTYPADMLELVTVKNGDSFPQEAATDITTKGIVRLARAVRPQTEPIRGAKPVATLEFKVVQASSSPLALTIDQPTSLLVRSTDNQNILKQVDKNTLELK